MLFLHTVIQFPYNALACFLNYVSINVTLIADVMQYTDFTDVFRDLYNAEETTDVEEGTY